MMELNEKGLRQLIDGDLEWLMQGPRTLEREHIKAILDNWVGDMQKTRALEAENETLRAEMAEWLRLDQESPHCPECGCKSTRAPGNPMDLVEP